jgi:superfamily II DNA/RNA helicase
MTTFSDLQLSEHVMRAVADSGYTHPTPIQEQAIPFILMGRDVLGSAQTGTGKTASFTLPMIDILSVGRARARMPRSLILEPTRELAAQVAENFDKYGRYTKLTKALLIGGESMADQLKVLERGADVLIATPGRLLDVFDRGKLLLSDIKVLVIDEADRMLDMGFIPDVERIVSLLARSRQTLFFSATMPPPIRRLADAFLTNPKEISVSPPATMAETVSHGIVVVSDEGEGALSAQRRKRQALRRLIDSHDVRNALIFCNRKRDVGVVHRSLVRHGYDAGLLHGDLAQSTRTEVLERMKRGDMKLLVCSDVAARGLDIEDLSHVLNFDVPSNPEDYVHRIGRTGRAGRTGQALTVALPEDGKYVAQIEQLIGKPIPRITLDGIPDAELVIGRRRRGGEVKGRKRPAPATRPHHDKPDNRAGNGQRKPPPAETTAPPPPPRAAAAATVAPPRRQRASPSSRPSSRDSDKPVKGLGDHVPAFLLREVKLPKKES